jgi:polysaccharide export outer membrane protein
MKRLLTTLTLVLAFTLAQLSVGSPAWALYRLDYGDNIYIAVKDYPQYSSGMAIRPDGAITLPFLGDIEVAGLTPTQLSERIAKLVGRYVRDPLVSVSVTGFRSRVVSIFGQVGKTGNVSVPAAPVNPTVIDAIAQAGGFTDRANRSEVLVIRGVGKNAERIIVDVDKMIRTGDFSQNLAIEDRDTIIVPEVWYPDYRQAIGAIGTVASVISMLALIASFYNRAAGQ